MVCIDKIHSSIRNQRGTNHFCLVLLRLQLRRVLLPMHLKRFVRVKVDLGCFHVEEIRLQGLYRRQKQSQKTGEIGCLWA